jgi:hypothetical protein
MSFQKLWDRLKLANAALENDSARVTLSVGELKRFVSKGYTAGYDDHKKLLEDVRKLAPKNPFEGLFGF